MINHLAGELDINAAMSNVRQVALELLGACDEKQPMLARSAEIGRAPPLSPGFTLELLFFPTCHAARDLSSFTHAQISV